MHGQYRFDETWSISLLLPLRFVRTTIQYRNAAGDLITLDYANIHHRNETLTGVGDPIVTARAQNERLYGEVGLSVPLGRTELDPFLLGEEGKEHEHFQFGSGTYRPILGTGAVLDVEPVTFTVWSLAILSLYENGQRYRAGHRLAGGVLASSAFGLEALSFRAGIEAQGELAERWRGEVPTTDGNRGRVDLMISAGITLRIASAWSLRLDARVPFYTRVTGGQLDYPAILDLGLARSFDD